MFRFVTISDGAAGKPPAGAFIFDQNQDLKSSVRAAATDDLEWTWDNVDNWHASDSGRATMQIRNDLAAWKMKLVATKKHWDLECTAHLAVHRQVWVWKLDAFEIAAGGDTPKYLFTVVTPRFDETSQEFEVINPGGPAGKRLGSAVQISRTFSPKLKTLKLADVKQVGFFVRRGVGEFFD